MFQTAYVRARWRCGKTPKPARVMKMTILLLFAACLQVAARTGAQGITLHVKNEPLANVFRELEKQSGYRFFYNETLMARARTVTLNLEGVSFEAALELCFRNQPFSYAIVQKTVVVKERDKEKNVAVELNAVPGQQAAQAPPPIDIRGRVTNENGEPVVATVMIKGSTRGTSTNEQGYFQLKGVDENAVLVISGVGIETREVPVSGRRELSIATIAKVTSLQEVVINKGYYTEKQKYSVSNVGRVTAKEIERQPVNNPLLALQGRVPGLEITQLNGIPGGGIKVRIQGRNNVNPALVGSDPLILIDGVPYMSQNLTTFLGGADAGRPILGHSGDGLVNNVQTGSAGNPLAFINPADIESIEVLKDADATAIYGSRAANGAILITTKRAKAGPMQVNVNLQQGWGSVGHKMDLLNSQQYMEMRREAKRNSNQPVLSTDYDLRGLWDTTRYTDWQKELIGSTAKYTNLTAGISGGNQTMQYLVSATWARERSVFPGDFANTRASVHFNLSAASPNQRFKMQLGGSYMYHDNKLPGLDATDMAITLSPVAPPLFKEDGSLNWAPDPQAGGNSSWINPLSRKYNLFDSKTGNLLTNAGLSYQIVPGLEIKGSFGFTTTSSDQFTAALNEFLRPEQRPGRLRSANFSFNEVRSWIVEPQLNFQRGLGVSKLSLLVGSTFQQQRNEGRGFSVLGQPSDQLLRNMAAGSIFSPAGLDLALYRYSAIFARMGYIYKDRYLFNLVGRRDGSSRFGANNQLQNFASLGLGWIISNEAFFSKHLPFISFAKLRASYGTTGNDQLGNYRFMSLYRSVNFPIPYQGSSGGLEPQRLPNPNLEWEETRKLQAGIDLAFLDNRFFLTVNYTRNRSSNSLTTINLPRIAGFGSIDDNLPALVQNTGWEFSVSSDNIQSKELRWHSSLNLSIPRNKLLAFPGLSTSSLANTLVIGRPLDIVRQFPFLGVDPLTGAYMIAGRNGNPTTSSGLADPLFYQTSASWYGGIQNSIQFKSFDFEIFVQFTKQNAFHVLEIGMPGQLTSNQPTCVMQRWQMPGDQSIYQRFSTTIISSNGGDRRWKDASYARLKNLSVSYRFLSLSNLGIKQLRVYMNTQNLLTLTRYRGLDPESLSTSNLPPLRMIVAGMQATF